MVIYFNNDRKKPNKETLDQMYKAADLCLESEELDSDRIELSVSFVSKDEIQELNREHRGVDAVTDVLSFPMFDGFAYIQTWDMIELGDVVICQDRCKEQAEELGHSYERELLYLFVHSMFHLLGYDHETEEGKAEMRAKEESVMEAIGVPQED